MFKKIKMFLFFLFTLTLVFARKQPFNETALKKVVNEPKFLKIKVDPPALRWFIKQREIEIN